ncbi:HAD family hydrolase [Yoonia sp. 208BN28-4]|uniref:HAD family hydrolase n=1 Tax=Yoonia sp. 208BN28-4 TaxID=3126505 RepID=UPI0030AE3977
MDHIDERRMTPCPIPAPPKLVIFDCDGVLVDSEPVTDGVIARNLARHGMTISEERVHALFVGGTMQGVMDTVRAQGTPLPNTWLDEIYSEMFAALAKGVPVYDGVMALLDGLDRADIPFAIASNGPMRKMETTLKPSGLWDRFAGRIYSGHDYTPKPSPDMLHHACQVAGVAVLDAVFIDDSPTGCKAAQNAGMGCLGFRPEGETDVLAATGAAPVRSMDAVMDLLAIAR